MTKPNYFYISTKTSALFSALVFFGILLTTSCSHKTLGLFFDVPPPTETANEIEPEGLENESEAESNSREFSFGISAEDTEPLPVEEAETWEQVLEMLPKDYKKGVDWSAAIEQGLIRPRTGPNPDTRLAAAFKYDFIIDSAQEIFNCLFWIS